MSDDPLQGFPAVIDVPVWWGDMDALNHVNNTVYLRWFESSRIAYTRGLGFWAMLETRKIGPILASVTCHYRAPIVFPDTVRVGSRVIKVGRTSITMEHKVVSQSAGDKLAAEGTSTLVLYDYNAATPYPIPDDIRAAIEEREGREGKPGD